MEQTFGQRIMQDWNAYIRYNIEDVTFTQRVYELIREAYRRELLPRFGSAWENMMYLMMQRTK